ncbi:hypothetical protein [Pseudomonas syringae group genomosp. 3]|uniref:hypothetical protein n=1 Tax=Pseudomonas syringae group genomosp. 3 TaxID=251701 RepID=UPI0005CAC74A|nr:hypothetical protein [Pseudomonas syringae group genomosp. 3]KPB98518.1 Uncharacterized protein AC506_4770 [Pseudomonas syringae pv. maculicola str. M6]
MAGGEVSAVAEMANLVANDLVKWFKWTKFPLVDQNFKCLKVEKHAAPRRKRKTADNSTDDTGLDIQTTVEEGTIPKSHNHPVDVILSYVDPYTAKRVMLNTDLKSYQTNSISKTMIRNALKSLGNTIECARSSIDWKAKYNFSEDADIRGLLFVYNHDGDYDKNFYNIFLSTPGQNGDKGQGKIDISNLPISKGQLLHIIEPKIINYMLSIINDSASLHTDGSFPETEYFFYYPELTLHKTKLPKEKRPATIELLSAPYLIIEHGPIKKYNEKTQTLEDRYKEGFIVYYNRSGSTIKEFIYLLDTLSSFQMLDRDCSLRLRIAHDQPAEALRSNFEAAKSTYAEDWGFDQYKIQKLERIELKLVEVAQKRFSATDVGWRI